VNAWLARGALSTLSALLALLFALQMSTMMATLAYGKDCLLF
jgi:hypothetical protein